MKREERRIPTDGGTALANAGGVFCLSATT